MVKTARESLLVVSAGFEYAKPNVRVCSTDSRHDSHGNRPIIHRRPRNAL